MEEVLALRMQQVIELARVELRPAAGRTGVDGDAVQVDAVQLTAALRTLHPVRLLLLLAIGRRHLLGVLLGPLLLLLEILPDEVFVFATAGLSVLGHASSSSARFYPRFRATSSSPGPNGIHEKSRSSANTARTSPTSARDRPARATDCSAASCPTSRRARRLFIGSRKSVSYASTTGNPQKAAFSTCIPAPRNSAASSSRA